MSVELQGEGLAFGLAKSVAAVAAQDIELTAGGRELLVTVPFAQGVTRPPILIENWTALLPAKQAASFFPEEVARPVAA